MSIFSTDLDKARSAFTEFVTKEKETYQGFTEPLQPAKTDMQTMNLVEEVVGRGRVNTLIRLDKVNRDFELRRLKDAGLSLGQIAKHTGISKSVIARA